MQAKQVGSISASDPKDDPTSILKVEGQVEFIFEGKGTYYGIATKPLILDSWECINQGTVFSYAANAFCASSPSGADLVLIFMPDYCGQSVLGVRIEEEGRLKYIDGCTDSVLIYPPKLGDPCVNHLHFPAGINQSFHTHPSIRLGYVLRGSGIACLAAGKQIPLKEGTIFRIEKDELHRFRTLDSSMDIIAFHPDSDVGPTDENHPMLNKTFIQPT